MKLASKFHPIVFISKKKYQYLIDLILELRVENEKLKARIAELEHHKNSNNSSIPPSKDENRAKRNQSLRERSGKKPGAQTGHEGSMLEMTDQPDIIIKHVPQFCQCCGMDVSELKEEFIDKRQVIDLPEIKPEYTEHRIYGKKCSCGYITKCNFPEDVKTIIQYGHRIESAISYFYARQFIPNLRMKEIFNHVFNIPISEGGINYLLKRFTSKAKPFYEIIRQILEKAKRVGSDETGANINGKNGWFWVWQNIYLTYIQFSLNRGTDTINKVFPNGLINAILNSDRWASQLQTTVKGNQLCTSHLQRDAKYLVELYGSIWASKLKALLTQAVKLKDRLLPIDFLKGIPERDQIEMELDSLLWEEIDEKHKKARTFQKKLTKQRNSILTFLYNPDVPPDNNGSERAIRNVKVKQKVSGYFKSSEGAQTFAINRSIIDTIIKSGNNVLSGLNCLAAYNPD